MIVREYAQGLAMLVPTLVLVCAAALSFASGIESPDAQGSVPSTQTQAGCHPVR